MVFFVKWGFLILPVELLFMPLLELQLWPELYFWEEEKNRDNRPIFRLYYWERLCFG